MVLRYSIVTFMLALSAPGVQFDVASIKPDKAGSPVSFGVGNGGASESNVTLKMMIALA
jgi:hypothetical protein